MMRTLRARTGTFAPDFAGRLALRRRTLAIRKASIWALLFSLLMSNLPGCMTPAVSISMPALSASPNPSFEGAYRVSWTPIAGASKYQLYENGKLSYRGPDLSHDYSGKAGGSYNYSLTYCVTAMGIEACNFKPAFAELTVRVIGGAPDPQEQRGAP